MSDYLDTSALVSILVQDSHTAAAIGYLRSAPDLVTSGWAAAEYSSALALQERSGRLSPTDRAKAETALDGWLNTVVPSLPFASEDAVAARSLLRSIQTPLRTPDALHLVICRRLGATLVSFDKRMRDAAKELGIPVRDV